MFLFIIGSRTVPFCSIDSIVDFVVNFLNIIKIHIIKINKVQNTVSVFYETKSDPKRFYEMLEM